MRTKIIIALLLLVFVGVGCTKFSSKDTASNEPPFEGVKPTGVTHELSDKNGQTVTTTPGDVLHFVLTSEAQSDKQWVIKSPTTGNVVLLLSHFLSNATTTDGKTMISDDWRLKVEGRSNFTLQYDYVPVKGGNAEQSFKVNIVSQ